MGAGLARMLDDEEDEEDEVPVGFPLPVPARSRSPSPPTATAASTSRSSPVSSPAAGAYRPDAGGVTPDSIELEPVAWFSSNFVLNCFTTVFTFCSRFTAVFMFVFRSLPVTPCRNVFRFNGGGAGAAAAPAPAAAPPEPPAPLELVDHDQAPGGHEAADGMDLYQVSDPTPTRHASMPELPLPVAVRGADCDVVSTSQS